MMRSMCSFRFGMIPAAALALAAGSAHAGFVYNNFASTEGLTLVGAATQSGNTLSVTPPTASAAGAAYRTGKVQVGAGFDTTFTFSIADINGVGSDGFAFVIQNQSQNAIGAPGGALGYSTNPVFPAQGTGIVNSLAIEFDTYNNQANWGDYNSHRHISVQSAGLLPNSPTQDYSLGGTTAGPAWDNGQTHTARIVYTPGQLDIYVDNLVTPLFSVAVNLSAQLVLDNNAAFIGFTAGTGGAAGVERHQIHSWSFSEATQAPAPASAALLGLGGLIASRRRRA